MEARARPGRVVGFDGAVVLGDDVLGDRQSQSRAAFAPAHERIEDALAQRFGDTGTIVGDLDVEREAVAPFGERHPRGAGAQFYLPLPSVAWAALRAMLRIACSRRSRSA